MPRGAGHSQGKSLVRRSRADPVYTRARSPAQSKTIQSPTDANGATDE
jgi:hypothetical protein